MTYTILFTDTENRTASILVVTYEMGDTSVQTVRMSHCKNAYHKAYLLTSEGFPQKPFYIRHRGEERKEVDFALAVLQEQLEGVPAQGGLAFNRPKD